MNIRDWECVIGLEVHAQLKTRSKIFSSDSSEFGHIENSNTSMVSLGMPGSLPVLNKEVIKLAVKTGLALACRVRERSIFSRKNYFYPDLPKGYQISQYDKPVCEDGFIEFYVDDEVRRIGIERAHLEEDAGKSLHHGEFTLLDFNRTGVPLLEIVSRPEIKSPREAAEFAKMMRNILRYIDVCDGNLEEGSLRCDCNLSVRKKGETMLGTKVEVKNVNSFRFVEKSMEYEFVRQVDCLESGKKIDMETRLYDSTKNQTFSMRKKEEAHDYRYFPDPDLLPLEIDPQFIEESKNHLVELPFYKAKRYCEEFGLSKKDSNVLVQEKELAEFFEETLKASGNAKGSANWTLGEVLRYLNDKSISMRDFSLEPRQLGALIKLIDAGKISGKIAKQVFVEMLVSNKEAGTIIEEKGLSQIQDNSLVEKIVDEVIKNHPDQVEEYRQGKQKVIGFFVGQIMKNTKGQADPGLVNKLLKEKLK